MGLFISRIYIKNFRNFQELDTDLSEKAVIIGENRVGKSNLLHALRLILDSSLPDSARYLTQDDFWDGLNEPMENKAEVIISLELKNFLDNKRVTAVLSDYIVKNRYEEQVVKLTYKFAPIPDFGGETEAEEGSNYEFKIFGGDDEKRIFTFRKWITLKVLPALRDAESDFEIWHRSPLKPLIERLKLRKAHLEDPANMIDTITDNIVKIDVIHKLSEDIEARLNKMIGEFHSISPNLGFASTDALKLIRRLRLFVDGDRQREIGEDSLGICNIIYLTLLILELERKEEAGGDRAATIIAIEEPEAHLHPHLQRLVYKDFFNRKPAVILTTHSPHIVSISPLNSLVVLRDRGKKTGTVATDLIAGATWPGNHPMLCIRSRILLTKSRNCISRITSSSEKIEK